MRNLELSTSTNSKSLPESAMEEAALMQMRASLELLQKLDAARWVRHDSNTHITYAWFGGHGIHGYNLEGTEVAFWNVGDFAEMEADMEEVRESIEERIKGGGAMGERGMGRRRIL